MADQLLVLDAPATVPAECPCCVGKEKPAASTAAPLIDLQIGRREFLTTTLIGGTGAVLLAACGGDEETISGPGDDGTPRPVVKMEIGFCSQVLCVLPYEVAVRQGFFKEEGYDINLVYFRGGALAMNALLSNSLDWVGTPMDLVVSAWGTGKRAVMVVSTANLPFFALVAAPGKNVNSVNDLRGKTVGIGNLNTTDHLLGRYLLSRAGIPEGSVSFVPAGANLYDGVLRGQVDAGMVQEPSLTLLERNGAKVLVNFMKSSDARETLGGNYQFMGLNTRPEVLEANPDAPRRLASALVKANRWIRNHSGAEIVKNVPEELVAGGDDQIFSTALDRVKNDLYPADGRLDQGSVQRVIDVQKLSGALTQDVKAEDTFTNRFLG
jgi:NitT/TauT family transport system substrate-binding protein